MPEAHDSLATPQDLEDAERYMLHDPREIARVLQSLADAGALISASIVPGGLPCPTALLDVDRDGNVLIDGNHQETVNQRIASAHYLACVSQLDRVRIQFRLQGLVRVDNDGRVAFAAAAPESLLKLQRRVGEMGARVESIDDYLKGVEADLEQHMLWLPNLPHESTIVAMSEDDNKAWPPEGEMREYDFEPKPHWAADMAAFRLQDRSWCYYADWIENGPAARFFDHPETSGSDVMTNAHAMLAREIAQGLWRI